jgi:hypothetical protein
MAARSLSLGALAQGDIFLAEAATNSDGSLTMTTPKARTVNNDRTLTDQWNAAITVKPGGTELFVGYYSRQNDASNSWIMAYGAKGDIANGLTNATFDCFPISQNSFPPLFSGTNADADMEFDPVYPPAADLCFDQYARVDCLDAAKPNPPCPSGDLNVGYYSSWVQDDNTWAAADSSYFYYAWCDRSRTWTNDFSKYTTNFNGQATSRPDADVKFAIIRQ